MGISYILSSIFMNADPVVFVTNVINCGIDTSVISIMVEADDIIDFGFKWNLKVFYDSILPHTSKIWAVKMNGYIRFG